MAGLTLISVNVRGIRDINKRKAIFGWAKSQGGDVVLLQETYSTPDIEDVWRRDWDGHIYFSHGSNHSRGIAILISSKLNFSIDQVIEDEEGRYILLKGEAAGFKLLLGSVYFPTRDKVKQQIEFLEKLDTCISRLHTLNCSLVLGGDFNVILNEKLDHMGSVKIVRSNFINHLQVFLRKYGLIDIWRKINPNVKQFTFKQKTPLVKSRLDYWFIPSNLEKSVGKCDIMTSFTPDHCGIKIEFKDVNRNDGMGKSYWKFNNSLCLDKHFVEGMINEILKIKEQWAQEFESKSLFWDFMKMKIREFARKFSKKKAQEKRDCIQTLEREIQNLERDLDMDQSSQNSKETIEEKRKELKQLYNESLEGLKVRSRATWYEEGEKNKEYFEQLLQSNKNKTIIRELYSENGEVLRDKFAILKTIRSFYENLYFGNIEQEDDESDSEFLKDIPKISEESRDDCEGLITKEECFEVLKSMKLNKSPGNDGLTVEFYLTFWTKISDFLVTALNESYDRGTLSISQRQGVITLIEKNGKDSRYVKNYRPITLLNVDYKILSKVLAKRLKSVLHEIINTDQVGYMKGRFIGEAIRAIDNMIFHCLNNQQDSYILAVDFEKAFDSVFHSFIFKALQRFGFGPSFCSWIKILYKDVSSCVMNGGFSTGYFDIKRGVRQGDPLSPYLFLIVIETLSRMITKDDGIKGIDCGVFEAKQILYADDMTVFVRRRESVDRLQIIFQAFQEVSGLKVNMEKTNIMGIGNYENSVEELPFGKKVREMKILGVYFSLDLKIREELNYKEILSKIKKLIGWWKQRDLSIMGKIHLLKTYALSKLNYVCSSLDVPRWVFIDIQKICFEFIWNGKDRIKRDILCQDFKDGGLRMINFELFIKSQRVMWVKRLLYGERNMSWKLYFDYIFKSAAGRFLLLCNYDIRKMSFKNVPSFYLDMLRAWQEMESCRHFDKDKINPIVFNNKDFIYKGKLIFNEGLYEKNVYHLDHIFDGKYIRPIDYFQRLGLNSKDIANIWTFCDVVLKSGKYKGTSEELYPVDDKGYCITLRLFEENIMFHNVLSRKIYEYFVKKLQTSYTLQVKDGYNNFNFPVKTVGEIFMRIRNTTLIKKLREFQFKLLHEVVYTKKHLLKFGFVEDNMCSFCQQEIELYPHLFWACAKVQPLWDDVKQRLGLEELQDITWQDIHVGLAGNSPRIKCCNSIIWIIKFAIYKSRADKVVPSVDDFKRMLIVYIGEEKEIAIKSGKMGMHLQKWESINI